MDPCFIVGCHRSGTTLAAAILDRHPQIAVPPETWFCRGVLPRYLAARPQTRAAAVEVFLRGPTGADLGLSAAEILARLDNPSPPSLFRAVLAAYAAKSGKSLAVEKTPVHLFYTPLLSRWYPKARFISVIRDGRDVALSWLRVPWGSGTLAGRCLAWDEAMRETEGHLRRLEGRYMPVRFETLLRDPEGTVKAIDEFLGLDYDPRQLLPRATGAILPHERPWKGKAAEALDPSRVGAWRKAATLEERRIMQALMWPYLWHFGYERDREVGLLPEPAVLRLAPFSFAAHRVMRSPRFLALAHSAYLAFR